MDKRSNMETWVKRRRHRLRGHRAGDAGAGMVVGAPGAGEEVATSVPYGLSASLWTNDARRSHDVAAKLDAGTV
jgi:hypothetical protein